MGISLLSCYHGAQIFEIYGLGKEVVDTAFFGSVSRVGGLTLADVQREAESFWVKVRRSVPPDLHTVVQQDPSMQLFLPGNMLRSILTAAS